MLEDYKEAFYNCACLVDGWEQLSKNDLCRKYVENKDNPTLQNAYFSAIMYRYWNLISKYYYMSCNVATPEDCYEWLEDSVYGCLKATSWDRADSSIYRDPNGPDKVINRCMKCARLTHYQFINRKKRKNNFGMLSLDELQEMFGNDTAEPSDVSFEDEAANIMIYEYIRSAFLRKDYFLCFMLDCIDSGQVFDTCVEDSKLYSVFNIKRLIRAMSHIDDKYLTRFAKKYDLDLDIVTHGFSYVKGVNTAQLKKKIQFRLEELKHDKFFLSLHGGTI